MAYQGDKLHGANKWNYTESPFIKITKHAVGNTRLFNTFTFMIIENMKTTD